MKKLEELVEEITEHGALLRETASTMTVTEFAEIVKSHIRLWGSPIPVYSCVNYQGCDYLWKLSDGTFDGWDINLRKVEQ